jgi:MFS family permease
LVGVVAGVAIIGVTVARGNLWGAILAAMGIFFIILAVTAFGLWQSGDLGRPATPKPARTGLNQNNSWLKRGARRLAAIWRTVPPAFFWWMLNRFLFWSAGIAIRTFLLNYMEDVLGMPPAEAQVLSSRIFLVLGGGVFLLAVPAGALADRVGRRPLLVLAGFLAAGGASFFLVVNEIPLLFVGGSLIAVGGGIFASASWSLATNLVPNSEGGQYLALANVATVLGSIGGRMGGPLIDGVNHLAGTVSLGYLIVFGLTTLFFALSSLVVLKISD